jgi:prepilin-type N-terminal cleavage/methylation domain-containing protein
MIGLQIVCRQLFTGPFARSFAMAPALLMEESAMKIPVSPRGLRGFTLIELLVVMALMLALVGLGIPALQLALHESKIRGISTEVTVLMRQARLDAIKNSGQTVVQIIPSTGPGDPGHIQAFSDSNSDYQLTAGEKVLGSIPLPTGISFVDCSGKTDKDSVDGFYTDPAGGPSLAVFTSSGSIKVDDGITDGAFRFGDPYGNFMEILAKPITTAKIQVLKCEAGTYVTNHDNGTPWTWK